MTSSTISSREFGQATGKAVRAARKGPVFITKRGKPDLVLLSIDDYQRKCESGRRSGSIANRLSMEEYVEVEFERVREFTLKPVDFD